MWSFAISIILCLGFWKIFCWCHNLSSTIYQCILLIIKKLLTKLIPINYNYKIFTPILCRWTFYCYEINNYSNNIHWYIEELKLWHQQNIFQKPRHNIIEIANENVILLYWTEAHPTNAHENTNNILFIIHMERFA
jgi:hypothetical protein